MKIEHYNTPSPQTLNPELTQDFPAFLQYQPDFKNLSAVAEKFKDLPNVLIIGHGGSITSFYGIYYALEEFTNKNAYFLSTVDPDYINELKAFLNPENTLVVAISKSGETVTQLEALMQFIEFPLLFITGSMGPLAEICSKVNGTLVLHPPIGGRFTGLTEVALLPAILVGLNGQEIYQAGKHLYADFQKENSASHIASIVYELEQQGYVDVFMPIYDSHLFPFANLFVQLCHESFGKDGKGQTFFAHHAPESQHHTNQRLFGGRKNMLSWFISSEKPMRDTVTVVPTELQSISLHTKTFGVLDKIPLSIALQAELVGTLEDAKLQNIPIITQVIPQRNEQSIGELVAFWQMFAVYSALLRQVNPFDQPQVENSKNISFTKRLQYKGLL